jgi:hypothetical protein
MYKTIPTYTNGVWGTTDFETEQSFIDYILSIFKEPGEYGFTKIAYKFND